MMLKQLMTRGQYRGVEGIYHIQGMDGRENQPELLLKGRAHFGEKENSKAKVRDSRQLGKTGTWGC